MKNSTLLFDTERVKKFFDILSRLGRHEEDRYKGYDKNNPHYSPCEKEIFVKRTIKKWFKGKYLIWWKVSEQTREQQQVYISIYNINFYLGYGNELMVNYYDYSKPMDIWNEIKLSHNDILDLEGKWCKNGNLHNKLLKMTYLNVPEKEYVFKAIDWNKYPKRKKKGWTEKDMEINISFKAKTIKGAYDCLKSFREKQVKEKTRITVFSDILEIKNI